MNHFAGETTDYRKLRRGHSRPVLALALLMSFLVFFIVIRRIEAVDVQMANLYSCDSSGIPQNYFPKNSMSYFNVTVRNTAQEPRNVSLHLTVQDELYVPLGTDQRDITVPQNSFAHVILNVFLPRWAYVGFATAYASVWVAGSPVDSNTTQFYIGPQDLTPPVVVITSPQNSTYDTEPLPLIFTVNERTTWMRYSLNGLQNVTVGGNTTLSGLSNGSNRIRVYANDTSGNIGGSEQVYFTMSIVHDVAVVNATCSPTQVNAGQIVDITVTVRNEGTIQETFNASAYANGTIVGTLMVSSLSRGSQENLVFSWNTTGAVAGNHRIVATATVVSGETDTLDNTYTDGYVRVTKAPVAVFTFSPVLPFTGETVTFDASLSTSEGGTIVGYEWNFGDGTSNETGMIVSHSYVDDGTYVVVLTVTDSDGLMDSSSQNITVLNSAPVASFTESATTVFTDDVVHFDASSSHDPDGSIVGYHWNFGDGTNATDVTLDHAYAHNGTFTVTLTVVDDDDASASSTTIMNVLNRPDVGVLNAVPSKTVLGQGYTLKINVTVTNSGDVVETFNVTVYAGTTPVDTKTIALLAGTSTSVTFTWNSSGFARQNYTMWAYAWPLPGETDFADNNFTDRSVLVTIAGDVTGPYGTPDGKVDMRDIGALVTRYLTTPSSPKWDPNCDLNGDGVVDMRDMGIASNNVGLI